MREFLRLGHAMVDVLLVSGAICSTEADEDGEWRLSVVEDGEKYTYFLSNKSRAG